MSMYVTHIESQQPMRLHSLSQKLCTISQQCRTGLQKVGAFLRTCKQITVHSCIKLIDTRKKRLALVSFGVLCAVWVLAKSKITFDRTQQGPDWQKHNTRQKTASVQSTETQTHQSSQKSPAPGAIEFRDLKVIKSKSLMTSPQKYQCACCQHFTLDSEQGHFDICPVCYWQDDEIQLSKPDYQGGANTISLNRARLNYKKIGAIQDCYLSHVRAPTEEEKNS